MPFRYTQVFLKGGARFPHVILAVLFIMLPAIILSSGLFFLGFKLQAMQFIPPVAKSIVFIFYMLAMTALGIGYLLIFIYTYLSFFLIVCGKTPVWPAIKQSYFLIKGNWINVFILIFIMAFFFLLCQSALQVYLGKLSKVVINLISFPLGVALMVAIYDDLHERAQIFP